MQFLDEYERMQAEESEEIDAEMVDTFCNNGYSVDLEEIELPEGITVNGNSRVFVDS